MRLHVAGLHNMDYQRTGQLFLSLVIPSNNTLYLCIVPIALYIKNISQFLPGNGATAQHYPMQLRITSVMFHYVMKGRLLSTLFLTHSQHQTL